MPGTQRLLRFNYASSNIGPGRLIVGNPLSRQELFDCTNCHNHCHFNQYADYRLWTPESYEIWQTIKAQNPGRRFKDILAENPQLQSGLIEGEKRGFCVGDVMSCGLFGELLNCPGQVPENASHPIYDPGTCAANQGISRGWADLYESSLDGQWVPAPDAGGVYILEVEANAERFIEETNYDNNIASTCVNIPGVDGNFIQSDPRCATPRQLVEGTECEMCEAVCQDLQWCNNEDASRQCSIQNCFCSSFCPEYQLLPQGMMGTGFGGIPGAAPGGY